MLKEFIRLYEKNVPLFVGVTLLVVSALRGNSLLMEVDVKQYIRLVCAGLVETNKYLLLQVLNTEGINTLLTITLEATRNSMLAQLAREKEISLTKSFLRQGGPGGKEGGIER